MTAHSFAVGDRVEGGRVGTEDYDTGRVIAVEGDRIGVAWDSQVMTWCGADELRTEDGGAVMTATYVPCAERDIPDGVRFDVPRRNQGQIIEVAYGGFGRGEHDDGDEFRRVTDRSAPNTGRYYRLVGG